MSQMGSLSQGRREPLSKGTSSRELGLLWLPLLGGQAVSSAHNARSLLRHSGCPSTSAFTRRAASLGICPGTQCALAGSVTE